MKKSKILTKPTRIDDMNFDDLYEEISADMDLKIERLMERRERALRRAGV